MRHRDFVGRIVQLRYAMRTNGGTRFEQGEKLIVLGAHRGRFRLQRCDSPPDSIFKVSRSDFDLVEPAPKKPGDGGPADE